MAAGLRRLGVRGLARLIEARGLVDRSEGLAEPFDKSDLSTDLGGPGWPKPVDKSEGLGAGPAQALSIKVRG